MRLAAWLKQVKKQADDILNDRSVKRVKDLLSFAAAFDQSSFLENRKVMRHGGFGHVELVSQLAGREFPLLAEQREDLASRRIRQCFKSVVEHMSQIV